MPDIRETEKSQIREIAKEYSSVLWQIPFSEGLILYVKTNNELYVHPARWRYCLKCGQIMKKEKLDEMDADHSCLLDVEEFPILIQTSWYKLKEFFLTDTYKKIMKETSVSKLPSLSFITASKETTPIDETKVPTAEKEKV